MLNVSYKNKIGYFTLTQGENKFRINICHANCLCAMMYFYTDNEGGEDSNAYVILCRLATRKELHKEQCA